MTNRHDNEEAVPLLANAPGQHNAVYDRFSSKKKKSIVALVSWCGLMPCRSRFFPTDVNKVDVVQVFASGSFFPTIPDIAKDLNTTGAVVRSRRFLPLRFSADSHCSITISLSVLAASLGALIASSYSSFCMPLLSASLYYRETHT